MTGHFTSYENRTDHELATPPAAQVATREAGSYLGRQEPLEGSTTDEGW